MQVGVAVEIRAGRDRRYPAGPRLLPRLLSGEAFRQSPAEFMLRTARAYGDLNHYRAFGRHVYQVNHPELVADFFLKDAPHHHRNLVMQRARDVLGNGLLTSEEPLHMRQRRLAQPAFLRERIAAYGEVIGANTLAVSGRWRPGEVVDVHREMLELALRIVGKCLFDVDALGDIAAMEEAVNSFMSFFPLAFVPFSRQIQRVPLPAMRRLERGREWLDRLIYGMIAERRADGRDRGDLLSMLLSSTEEGEGDGKESGPARMTDQQLRDECVTIILAGHETTANALSFGLHLLARHPEVQERLHGEASEVLGGRPPTAADYGHLPYATRVFAETLRMYPPVWVTARTVAEPYEIAGYRLPRGAVLVAPQYAVHRDPRFFPEPERFDPERFTEEAKAGRPRYSYFPFAGGSRQCIGEGLAWMEGTLALAVIARDWRLSPAAGGRAELAMKAAISLRPSGGVPLRVERRR